MNARLKDIIERVETWPQEAQEEAVELLLAIEREHSDPYELTADDRAALDRSLEEMRQGRFATNEEVEAVFDRRRRRT